VKVHRHNFVSQHYKVAGVQTSGEVDALNHVKHCDLYACSHVSHRATECGMMTPYRNGKFLWG